MDVSQGLSPKKATAPAAGPLSTELERPEAGIWQVGVLQYWDRYVRIEGEWYFERRKFHRFYIVDALTRPRPGAGLDENPLTTIQLPSGTTADLSRT